MRKTGESQAKMLRILKKILRVLLYAVVIGAVLYAIRTGQKVF